MNRSLPLLTAALLLLAPLGAAADDEAAWEALEAARDALAESSPLAARFVQTYVPAGFSSGDEESGRIYLSLPACVRWDYQAPYPRSYMLCGNTVWSWSPDEAVGDRRLAVSREEAGVDFLLLGVERLRQRYEARLESADGERVIHLEPRLEEVPFARATITLDATSDRPAEIAYVDRQGNTTRFRLSDYGVPEGDAIFEPPAIRWVDG